MKYYPLDEKLDSLKKYEAIVRNIEDNFSVSITLHDLYGKLFDADRNPLLPGRNRHSHPCCERGRLSVSFWEQACQRDCSYMPRELAREYKEPYWKDCHMGLRELVVPVANQSGVQLIFFAGVFRNESNPEKKTPDWFLKMREELPENAGSKMTLVAEILRLLGIALLNEAIATMPVAQNDRLDFIRRYIYEHAHENISLENLAAELFISASRAGHLIQELSGRSFGELLKEERMSRAQHLLLTSGRTLADIAEAVGYSNSYYFNRIFSQYFSCAPGKYRAYFFKHGKTPPVKH